MANVTLDLTAVVWFAGAITAIAAAVTVIYKLITRDLTRDIADVRKDVTSNQNQTEHKMNNLKQEIVALNAQHSRVKEDVILLKADVAAVKDTTNRLEHGQEKLQQTLDGHFEQLAESIREIRVVRARATPARKKP